MWNNTKRSYVAFFFLVFILTGFNSALGLPAVQKVRTTSNFLSDIYLDLLGRAPSSSDIATLQDLILQGSEREDIVDLVIGGAEFRSNFITSLFSDYLGREVDPASLDSLLDALEIGIGQEGALIKLLSSNEYVQAQGSLLNYIRALFHDLFGREPTEDEVRIIAALLATGGPTVDAVAQLVHSDEYFNILVRRFYNQFLGRDPSSLEIGLLGPLAAGNDTFELLQRRILGSQEYFNRAIIALIEDRGFKGFIGNFKAPDGELNASDFRVRIKWGDGRRSKGFLIPATGGEFGIYGAHTFKRPGVFLAKIKIRTPSNQTTRRFANIKIVPQLSSLFPFPGERDLGVSVASGDFNHDGIDDIIVGSGAGGKGGPQVKAFNGLTGDLLLNFLAYDAGFSGGVFVAAGDINGDGVDDIVTGAGPGSGPHVKVFSGVGAKVLTSFFAYDPGFIGGVRVATGDVNGDGLADVITGAGPGGVPHVKAFGGNTGSLLLSFLAYDIGFQGGVFVASGDVNGDGRAELITATGAGTPGVVKTFSFENGEPSPQVIFNPYGNFTGGVSVATGDINGDGLADIVTGTGAGAGPHVKVFKGSDPVLLASFFAFSQSYKGGVYVAAGDVDGDGRVSVVVGSAAGRPRVVVKRF